MVLGRLGEEFLERHPNPWSGLTRMLIVPFLYAAIWYHNWLALGPVILWILVNPFIFPKPGNWESWFSRVVVGEKK